MAMSRSIPSLLVAMTLARSTVAFSPAAMLATRRGPAAAISAPRNVAFGGAAFPASTLRTAAVRGLSSLNMKERERTFIMVKPDAVQRGLVGNIISRFEQKGFKLVALKMVKADEALLKEHYKDLVSKPFFPSLMSYMTSGPVVPMVGTVRGDYAIDVGRNVCHGSDAVDTAKREIGLWFKDGVTEWDCHSESWIYE
ncbi:nucleoside diphosphate kinase [Baffinella frigidus]|nr:nucleoside diphosphate kinase [Cryptophyta sp. CCMP2293]